MAFKGKAKIIVVGPPEAGKTIISNLLSESTGGFGNDYQPTQGVRILEFEVNSESLTTGKLERAEVELWDCGGGKQFECCWPAFAQNVNGVVLVYSPHHQDHENNIIQWFGYLVKQHKLRESQFLIVAHQTTDTSTISPKQGALSKQMSTIRHITANVTKDPDNIRAEFSAFVIELMTVLQDKQDKEELKIVN